MILGTSDPFFNEPSASFKVGDLSSLAMSTFYTKNVQCKTVLHAMLWWLYSGVAKDSIWGGISKTYWECKGYEVLQTVRNWARCNEWLRTYDKTIYQRFGNRQQGIFNASSRYSQGKDLVMELEKHLGPSASRCLGKEVEWLWPSKSGERRG